MASVLGSVSALRRSGNVAAAATLEQRHETWALRVGSSGLPQNKASRESPTQFSVGLDSWYGILSFFWKWDDY